MSSFKYLSWSLASRNSLTFLGVYAENVQPSFWAMWLTMWFAYICFPVLDPCDSSPCINGGICRPVVGEFAFSCFCPDGFEGPRCEVGEWNKFSISSFYHFLRKTFKTAKNLFFKMCFSPNKRWQLPFSLTDWADFWEQV